MKPINKLKLNFAYDLLFFEGHGKKQNVGVPNLFYLSKSHKDFFPTFTDFYNVTLKDLEEKHQLSFPYDISNKPLPPSWFSLTHNSFVFNNGYEDCLEVNTVKYFLEKNEKFIYPISIFKLDFFNETPPLLPPLVTESISRGLVKIVIFQLTEGYPYGIKEFNFLNTFSDINNLNPNNFCILSGNLILQENYNATFPSSTLSKYSLKPSYHFEDTPWFINGEKHTPGTRVKMWEHFEDILHYNRTREYDQYFLCYQRRSREFRIWVFAQTQLNNSLKNKTSISLGAGENYDEVYTVKENIIEKATQQNRSSVEIEFIKNLDLGIDYKVDECDLHENQAHSLDIGMHNSHFLSLVSETSTDNSSIFFSEKIFKPVYMLQPFILISGQHSLKKFKELGYKTFSKYWSEDYDNCENYMDRMDKIQIILEEISTWSLKKCQEIYLDMEDILTHNFHQLMKLDRYYNTLKELDCE